MPARLRCTVTGAHTRRDVVCVCVAPQTRLFPHSTRTFYLASLFLSPSASCVCAPDRRHTSVIAVLRRNASYGAHALRTRVRVRADARECIRVLPPCVARRRPLVASFRYQRETSLSLTLFLFLFCSHYAPLTVLFLLYASLSPPTLRAIFSFSTASSPPPRLLPLLLPTARLVLRDA